MQDNEAQNWPLELRTEQVWCEVPGKKLKNILNHCSLSASTRWIKGVHKLEQTEVPPEWQHTRPRQGGKNVLDF